MARTSVFRDSSGEAKLYYDVNFAVGPGATNKRDDVLLVQYFLRECFLKHSSFKTNPFPKGVVAVDGIAGQQTFAAILHFQKAAKARGSPVALDGRVDPPVGEKATGSISQTQYTILLLNSAFKQCRPQDWSHVSQAGDCPSDLRPLLREPTWNWGGAAQ